VHGAVFGSMARGRAEPDSDVDLLLVRPDEAPEATWEAQVGGLSSAVTRWTGNDARPVEFSLAELKRRRKDPLFHDLLAQGLTVAGEREWFRRQLGAK
jgi:predicted nucleotidyltransferase